MNTTNQTPKIEQVQIQRNIEIAKKQNLEVGYFFKTEEYGTSTGNRLSIATTVFHAIKHKDRLLNKTFVTKVESDLVRNYTSTKSTKQTHLKKIEKLRIEYPTMKEMDN